MMVSIISMWTWRVGLSYVLRKYLGLGLYGTWAAMYVDWVCRSAFFITSVKKEKWVKEGT